MPGPNHGLQKILKAFLRDYNDKTPSSAAVQTIIINRTALHVHTAAVLFRASTEANLTPLVKQWL